MLTKSTSFGIGVLATCQAPGPELYDYPGQCAQAYWHCTVLFFVWQNNNCYVVSWWLDARVLVVYWSSLLVYSCSKRQRTTARESLDTVLVEHTIYCAVLIQDSAGPAGEGHVSSHLRTPIVCVVQINSEDYCAEGISGISLTRRAPCMPSSVTTAHETTIKYSDQ